MKVIIVIIVILVIIVIKQEQKCTSIVIKALTIQQEQELNDWKYS